jgi:hypothetical protein
MKTKVLSSIFAISCMAFTATSFAQTGNTEPIPLQVSDIDPTSQHGDTHKSPILIPSISLDDHTLYFFTPCDGCVLNIVDGSGALVYTLVIPAGTTSLELPATLTGDYELQIIRGNYCFWGEIVL